MSFTESNPVEQVILEAVSSMSSGSVSASISAQQRLVWRRLDHSGKRETGNRAAIGDWHGTIQSRADDSLPVASCCGRAHTRTISCTA
jgi:hypothetical protein